MDKAKLNSARCVAGVETAVEGEDETDITEITIQPDGRIYVFGASRQVVEMLWQLNPSDVRLPRLLSSRQPAKSAQAAQRPR